MDDKTKSVGGRQFGGMLFFICAGILFLMVVMYSFYDVRQDMRAREDAWKAESAKVVAENPNCELFNFFRYQSFL